MVRTERISLALAGVRTFLPDCWRWTHQNYISNGQNFFLDKRKEIPDPLSTDMCRHTTLFLLNLLQAAADNTWKVAGGFANFADSPGVFEQSGRWGQHWWLSDGELLLDLTADQLGWPDVVVAEANDSRYFAQPKLSKRSYVSTLARTVGQWEGLPSSFWMAQDPAFKVIQAGYSPMKTQFLEDWHRLREER